MVDGQTKPTTIDYEPSDCTSEVAIYFIPSLRVTFLEPIHHGSECVFSVGDRLHPWPSQRQLSRLQRGELQSELFFFALSP